MTAFHDGLGSERWSGQRSEQGFDGHTDGQDSGVAVDRPLEAQPDWKAAGRHAGGQREARTPTQLPGPMLRMVVVKVPTGGPPSTDIVLEPLTASMDAGRTGEVGNMIASTPLFLK